MMGEINWQQGRGCEYVETPFGRYTLRPQMSQTGTYYKWLVWGPSSAGGPVVIIGSTSRDCAREIAEDRIRIDLAAKGSAATP